MKTVKYTEANEYSTKEEHVKYATQAVAVYVKSKEVQDSVYHTNTYLTR